MSPRLGRSRSGPYSRTPPCTRTPAGRTGPRRRPGRARRGRSRRRRRPLPPGRLGRTGRGRSRPFGGTQGPGSRNLGTRCPGLCHCSARGATLPREGTGRVAKTDARAGAAEFADGRVRVRHGELVARVPKGHLVLLSDGLGEFEAGVDVPGVDRKGRLEPTDRTRDLVPVEGGPAELCGLQRPDGLAHSSARDRLPAGHELLALDRVGGVPVGPAVAG